MTPRTASFAQALGELTRLVREGAVLVRDTLGTEARARRSEHERLVAIEAEARAARDALNSLVANSFVTPFDRGDLHALASALTATVTHLERVVDAGIRHRVDEFPEGFSGMVDSLVRMADLTVDGIAALHTAAGVGDFVGEVRRLEVRSEQVRRDIITETLSSRSDPLRAVREARVVDELAAATRALEHVATVVEGIVVKES